MNFFKFTLVALFLVLAIPAVSQLTIDGQFRPRFEFRDGYSKLTNDSSSASAHISQRTRIGLSFAKDKFTSRVSFQDVRTWGEQKGKSMTVYPSAHELWFGVQLHKDWKIKVGRQEIAYDNQRMVGTSNYNQIGRSHDAFKIEYKKDKFAAQFTTAFNQNKPMTDGTYYDMPGFYKTLNILWLSYATDKFKISSLTIADGAQDPANVNSTYQRYTPGLITNIQIKMFRIDARYFAQLGKDSNGTDVNASYFNAEVKFNPLKNLNTTFGTELRSGNDIYTEERNDFKFIVSSNHSFNGIIDYFNSATSTNGAGLANHYIKLNYAVNKKLNLMVDFHTFSSQQTYILDGTEYDKKLANEVDFGLKYKFDKLSVYAAYAIIMAEETVSVMKGGDNTVPGNFFHVMMTYKPVFLN